MTTELVKRGIKNNSKIFSGQQVDMGLFIQIGKNREGTYSLERLESKFCFGHVLTLSLRVYENAKFELEINLRFITALRLQSSRKECIQMDKIK